MSRLVGGAVDVFMNNSLEGQRLEAASVTGVELVLELDPMQTDVMEACRQRLHHHEHSEGQTGPHGEREKHANAHPMRREIQLEDLQDHRAEDRKAGCH